MQLSEVMTNRVEAIRHEDSVRWAAKLMRDMDVGVLPVMRGDELAGTVTDRDIAIRAVAGSLPINTTPVSMIMSNGVVVAREDEEVEEAVRSMEQHQVRRLFVLDSQGRCIGVVSQGDVAVRGQDKELGGELVEEVSKMPD